jgi:hypothetical protein
MKNRHVDNSIDQYIKKLPFTMANILGRDELRESRMTIFFIVIVFIMGLALLSFALVANLMRSDAADARANQKIHVYPEGDGVFVEKAMMPESHILGFVSRFEDYYFNWSPESVKANMEAAEKMMSQDFIYDNENIKNTHLKHGFSQRISQVVAKIPSEPDINRESIKPLSHGFEVIYAARKKRLISGEVFSRSVGKIRLIVQRVEPNAHYKWGLRVVKIEEEWNSESL